MTWILSIGFELLLVASGLEIGVYIIGVLFEPIIVFWKDMEKLKREEGLVNPTCDVGRER